MQHYMEEYGGLQWGGKLARMTYQWKTIPAAGDPGVMQDENGYYLPMHIVHSYTRPYQEEYPEWHNIDPELVTVVDGKIYFTPATPAPTTYTVTFVDGLTNEVIATQEVEEGTAATQIVRGVAFDAESGVAEAVAGILDPSSSDNYVRLALDQTTEKITLADKKVIKDLAELGPQCPMDMPAFHLFRYSHEHEDKHYDTIIFIYSCPDGSGKTKSAPIKARMTYSSCKGAIEALVTDAGKTVDVRLEINDGEHDLDPQDVKNAVHPPPIVKKAAFAKPKPKGKGPRRLTKVQE